MKQIVFCMLVSYLLILTGCDADRKKTFIPLPPKAPPPSIELEWQKMYGGNAQDGVYSIVQADDGGYVLAGSSKSTDISGCINKGRYDFLITKLNAVGNLAWQKTFGGNHDDIAHSIQETNDNGYIIAGESLSSDISGCPTNGFHDFYVIKLDSLGNLSWQQMYGGNSWDAAKDIQQTSDNGFVIAGYSSSRYISGCTNNGSYDVYVVKLDADGNVMWQCMYGGSDTDIANAIRETDDNGFIIAGISDSTDVAGCPGNGQRDCYVIKIDSSGNLLWQKLLGGTGSDYAYSVLETAEGDYVVSGQTSSTDIAGCTSNGMRDCYFIKLDPSGEIIWQKLHGGNEYDRADSIALTDKGNYIAAGLSYSTDIEGCTNISGDYYISLLNPDGEIITQKGYGGSNYDIAQDVRMTDDGGCIVAGVAWSTDIPGCTNRGMFDTYILKLKITE